MPISSPTVPNWSALERKILEGGYELEQCLNPSEGTARFKVRILGDRFTEAIADVFAPGAVPRGQVALWSEAAGLSHPNINIPISAGELFAEGSHWPYFVRLRPDETLGTVLAERALTADETREVARSITAALEYLHGNGYVHGGVSPENVLALGNSIQLSTLYLHRANVPVGPARAGARFRAPETPLENSTPEADIYCLGCALFEVLTGKRVTADCPADPVELPQPFAFIVDRCLEPDPEKRLRLSSIQALLEGRQIAQPVVEPEPEPEMHELAMAPVEAPIGQAAGEGVAAITEEHIAGSDEGRGFSSEPEPAVAGNWDSPRLETVEPRPRTIDSASAPSSDAGDRIRIRREAADRPYTRHQALATETPESSKSKPWMWVVLVAVLLGGILWLARPKAANKAQPTVTPQSDVSHAGAAAPIGGASHTIGPDGAAPAHVSSAPASTPAGTSNEKGRGHNGLAGEKVWRVVAWTFAREADAEKRVEVVKQKHPDFNPEVFSPHGHGAPYLVSLGGQMTRPEAERMRQKARAAGLPRDSYVQNYSR